VLDAYAASLAAPCDAAPSSGGLCRAAPGGILKKPVMVPCANKGGLPRGTSDGFARAQYPRLLVRPRGWKRSFSRRKFPSCSPGTPLVWNSVPGTIAWDSVRLGQRLPGTASLGTASPWDSIAWDTRAWDSVACGNLHARD